MKALVEVRVSLASDRVMLDEAFAIRKAVFVHEQKVPLPLEFDGLDQACDHLLARAEGRALGTLRLRALDDRHAKIERVAVLEEARGLGIGAALVETAVTRLAAGGFRSVKLHAQTYALGFYARLGFTAEGDVFEEDGIPHKAMWRRLDDLAGPITFPPTARIDGSS